MADVEHKNLTDPQLHEPKGVGAASSNQVYVADGAGSGDWESQAPSHAIGYISSNSTATTISASGAGNEVEANFGGSFNSDIATGFTISVNGDFTYDESESRTFFISATASANQSSAASKEFEFFFAKNGTIIASSLAIVETDGSVLRNFTVGALVSLSQNDVIDLRVRNNTDTTNVTIEDASIRIIQLGF